MKRQRSFKKSNDLPLKKIANPEKEKKQNSGNNNRQQKNKYTNNFTFKYSNFLKKSENSQNRDSNHKRKKSQLNNLSLGSNNKAYLKKMKKLYMKEIENRKDNTTSVENLRKSPSRSKKDNSDFDDSMSQMSDFSHFSKNRMMKSKGSYSNLGSANRKKSFKNRSNGRGKHYLNDSYLSNSETDLGGKRDPFYNEIEKANDEFIEIQGIGGLTKKSRNDKKRKKNKPKVSTKSK
jgi:hypothetical protein